VSQLTLAPNNSFGHRIADFCRTEGTASGPDALARVGELPEFNGSAVAMGFCYGVPYAILGPKRLGHAAGISCHGIQMLDYLHELEDVSEPVCILWGDRDHRASIERLSRCGITKEECGGTYLSRCAARLQRCGGPLGCGGLARMAYGNRRQMKIAIKWIALLQ
jgi:Dienelactone hydrolase family